jgi:hypothetical protein
LIHENTSFKCRLRATCSGVVQAGTNFGSEPKAIWALQGKQNNINYNKNINFLVNGYKSLFKDNEDFFEGLERVDPGFIETFNSNN